MENAWLYTILSVLVVSLVSFVGVLTLSLSLKTLKKITLYLVSLSAGTLLGGSFLHLLPEAVEKSDNAGFVWFSLLTGIVLFFVLEKIVCWRHCHIPTSDEHPHNLGAMNLIGDGFHNLIDGMVIAAAFLVNANLGLATAMAVIIHEIPQELGDFGVLIHSGLGRAKALLLNFTIALAAVAGAVLTLVVGSRIENFVSFLVPFAAGGFIYIAAADLIPELKKDIRPSTSLLQLLTVISGIALMYGLKILNL